MLSSAAIVEKKQKLGIDESSLIKLEDSGFANIIDPKFGISRKKVMALKLLLFDFNNTDNQPSQLEKKIIQEFLTSIQGDMEFNKELQQIARMDLAGKGRGAMLVGSLIKYTYKTRHIIAFDMAFKKLEKSYDKLISNVKIAEEQKLTIKEYASLYEVAHIQPILETFSKKGFFYGVEYLEGFYQKVIKSAAITMQMKDKYKMINNNEK
jgi:hypothetical protein